MPLKYARYELEFDIPADVEDETIEDLIAADSKWDSANGTCYRIGKYPDTVDVELTNCKEMRINILKVRGFLIDPRMDDLVSKLREAGLIPYMESYGNLD
ncbi:hypothetical protein ACFL3V_05835 [Nanoarchaeota archaeon]